MGSTGEDDDVRCAAPIQSCKFWMEGVNAKLDLLKHSNERFDRTLYGRYNDETGKREMGLADALPVLRMAPRFAIAIIVLLFVIAIHPIMTPEAWKVVVHIVGGG